MSRQYVWKGVNIDIENYINICVLLNKMPMVITDTAAFPFVKVYLDLVCPMLKPVRVINISSRLWTI